MSWRGSSKWRRKWRNNGDEEDSPDGDMGWNVKCIKEDTKEGNLQYGCYKQYWCLCFLKFRDLPKAYLGQIKNIYRSNFVIKKDTAPLDVCRYYHITIYFFLLSCFRGHLSPDHHYMQLQLLWKPKAVTRDSGGDLLKSIPCISVWHAKSKKNAYKFILNFVLHTSNYLVWDGKQIMGKLPDHLWPHINTLNFDGYHTLTQIFQMPIIIIFSIQFMPNVITIW